MCFWNPLWDHGHTFFLFFLDPFHRTITQLFICLSLFQDFLNLIRRWGNKMTFRKWLRKKARILFQTRYFCSGCFDAVFEIKYFILKVLSVACMMFYTNKVITRRHIKHITLYKCICVNSHTYIFSWSHKIAWEISFTAYCLRFNI